MQIFSCIDRPAEAQTLGTTLFGVAAAFTALAAWTTYAAGNQAYMRRGGGAASSGDWATLQGIGTLLWVVVAFALWTLAASVLPFVPEPHVFAALAEPSFLGWCLFLGIGASWVGTALWNYGAKALPATLSGQMIVFETIFALLYGFMLEARAPRILEMIAIVCLVGGAIWAMRVHAPGLSPHPRGEGQGEDVDA